MLGINEASKDFKKIFPVRNFPTFAKRLENFSLDHPTVSLVSIVALFYFSKISALLLNCTAYAFGVFLLSRSKPMLKALSYSLFKDPAELKDKDKYPTAQQRRDYFKMV